jgi:hypothetical protein
MNTPNLEERVARLEQRNDQMDRIEQAVVGLRADFNAYRRGNGAVLERILATLRDLQRRPIVFRWPWERVQ